MDFNFELGTDANANVGATDNYEIGAVLLGETDSVNGKFRVRIDRVPINNHQEFILRFLIERIPPGAASNPGTYWTCEYIHVFPNLEKDFEFTVVSKTYGSSWIDFYWFSFNFKLTPTGLHMTKIGLPKVKNACNLGNDTLRKMVLQEGIILNNFNLVVIKNILKRRRKNDTNTVIER